MMKVSGSERARIQRAINIRNFGSRCKDCGMTEAESEKIFGRPLEFHHLTPTSISGMGRGSYARAMDVKNHPEAYELLDRKCHIAKHPDRFKAGDDE